MDVAALDVSVLVVAADLEALDVALAVLDWLDVVVE
jgi:hypothetical protein